MQNEQEYEDDHEMFYCELDDIPYKFTQNDIQTQFAEQIIYKETYTMDTDEIAFYVSQKIRKIIKQEKLQTK